MKLTRFFVLIASLIFLSRCSTSLYRDEAVVREIAELKAEVKRKDETIKRLREDIKALNMLDAPDDFQPSEKWTPDAEFVASVKDNAPFTARELTYFLHKTASFSMLSARQKSQNRPTLSEILNAPGKHRGEFFRIEGKLLELELRPSGDEVRFGPQDYWVATILAGTGTGDRPIRLYFIETLRNAHPGDRVITYAVFMKTRRFTNSRGKVFTSLGFAAKKLFKVSEIGY